MKWYLAVMQNYIGFEGRAHRTEYWMFTLFNLLIALGVLVLDIALGTLILYPLYVLALVIPSLAVSVRRLHDINRSGWWVLLAIIPLGALVLLVFHCIEGDKGSNVYGQDPWAGA